MKEYHVPYIDAPQNPALTVVNNNSASHIVTVEHIRFTSGAILKKEQVEFAPLQGRIILPDFENAGRLRMRIIGPENLQIQLVTNDKWGMQRIYAD